MYQTGECNDTTGAIHPGIREICDLLDNNCNGVVDEFVKTTYYQDADSDNRGSGLVTTGACSLPAGYVLTGQDCVDTDARLNPTTQRWIDADTDGFSSGSNATQCTGPVDYYLPGQLVTTSNFAAGLYSGLVGHWTFDYLDGRDESGNGYTGTKVGDVSYTGGKVEKAANFDGSGDYFQTT